MHAPVRPVSKPTHRPAAADSGRPAKPAATRLTRLPARGPRVTASGQESARQGASARNAVELGFGPHLVFDGHDCPVEKLSDLDGLYALLDRLPEQIGMTKIMPPYVFRHGVHAPANGGSPDEGLSGFVLIAESHISVHTFPSHGFVNVDLFSCQTFDVELVLGVLQQAFAPGHSEWKLLDRGREFPKLVGPSRASVLQDRWEIARNLGLEVSR